MTKMWLTYWWDKDTGRFRQRVHATVSEARATAAEQEAAGHHRVTVEYAEPYRISR